MGQAECSVVWCPEGAEMYFLRLRYQGIWAILLFFNPEEAVASEGAVMTPGTCMNVRIVKKNWILPICFTHLFQIGFLR